MAVSFFIFATGSMEKKPVSASSISPGNLSPHQKRHAPPPTAFSHISGNPIVRNSYAPFQMTSEMPNRPPNWQPLNSSTAALPSPAHGSSSCHARNDQPDVGGFQATLSRNTQPLEIITGSSENFKNLLKKIIRTPGSSPTSPRKSPQILCRVLKTCPAERSINA